MDDNKRLRVVWGGKAIGSFIGRPPRRTFYMLERGLIPARKVGGIWVSTEGELEALVMGRAPAPNREVA
jgi:hypothetical protein